MAALSEEQSIIRDQAKSWVSEQAPVGAFRKVRDDGVPLSFDAATWQSMIEMGWTGIVVPEQYGGSDLGYLTFGLILEEVGRQLTASPLFASAYAGATALRLAGSEEQKAQWLPKVVDGSVILALAIDEGPRHKPDALTTEIGATVSGRKSFVMEGMAATHFVVAGRGGSLAIVPADATGVSRERLSAVDSRGYANVEFNEVEIADDQVLAGATRETFEALLDACRAGLAAEMLGTAGQAFDMTLDYLKTRVQFGKVIGSFQALGHRAADHFTAMELARSCMEAGLSAVDEGSQDRARLVSLSKCRVGEFLYDMSNDLIQIHGGIGMTDEFDAGLYLKRARTLEAALGNRGYHRDRYAKLLNF